jgi:DNA (cytosine-5)-methyltransferase 1
MSLGSQSQGAAPFTYIDLFAGIGGLRLGFHELGGECVFTSEWNKFSQKTYAANYPGDGHAINGDITKVAAADIPAHDLLLAGFPCQPFSIAGISKKNSLGRKHGFEDETQGTLFFDVARIIAERRPKAFLLENVKNLVSHDKGNTFDVIRRTLTEQLGYVIQHRVIDAQKFVPQHRERIFIVGFREDVGFSFDDMTFPDVVPPVGAILLPEEEIDPKYVLSNKLWDYLRAYAAKHNAKGNGFGYGLVTPDMACTRTLSARYYKDGSEVLVSRGEGRNPRKLTPRECVRLMGFPDDWVIPVSDAQAYRQFGNSVAVPVVRELARLIVGKLGAVGALRKAA